MSDSTIVQIRRIKNRESEASVRIPLEFQEIFKNTTHAIVERKGNSLIYKPIPMEAL